MAGVVAARTLAAEVTWATAALLSPGTLLGKVSLKLNTTLPAETCRIGTQVGAVQLSCALSAFFRVVIRVGV